MTIWPLFVNRNLLKTLFNCIWWLFTNWWHLSLNESCYLEQRARVKMLKREYDTWAGGGIGVENVFELRVLWLFFFFRFHSNLSNDRFKWEINLAPITRQIDMLSTKNLYLTKQSDAKEPNVLCAIKLQVTQPNLFPNQCTILWIIINCVKAQAIKVV